MSWYVTGCPKVLRATAHPAGPTKTLECLSSSDCNYRTHSESGDHHYEVSFEYGPPSLDGDLPFKKVFHVYKCTVGSGQVHGMDP